MMYEVRFLWNDRGRSTVDHIVRCVLPEGIGPFTVRDGFWVVDDKRVNAGDPNTWFVTFVDTRRPPGPRDFWVPPSRITGIVPLPTGKPELP